MCVMLIKKYYTWKKERAVLCQKQPKKGKPEDDVKKHYSSQDTAVLAAPVLLKLGRSPEITERKKTTWKHSEIELKH